MPITHHPPDDTVLRYANGALPEAPAIVVATHLSFCAPCRHRMQTYEMLGGSLLEDVAPSNLSADALSATLAKLNAADALNVGSGTFAGESRTNASLADVARFRGVEGSRTASTSEVAHAATTPGNRGATQTPPGAAVPPPRRAGELHPPRQRPDLPSGMAWPQPLLHYDIPAWRLVLPGVKWTKLSLTGPKSDGQLLLVHGLPGAKLPSHGHEGTEYTCVLTGSFSDSDGIYTIGDLIEATEDHDHQPVVGPEAECVCLIAIEGHLRLHGLARLLQPFLGL